MKGLLAGFLIWVIACILQINVFHIEHDAFVMLYGGVTVGVMIVVIELFNKGETK